jgi:hypothetical protein
MNILEALAEIEPEKEKLKNQERDEYGRLSMHDAVFERILIDYNAPMSLMDAPIWDRDKIYLNLQGGIQNG